MAVADTRPTDNRLPFRPFPAARRMTHNPTRNGAESSSGQRCQSESYDTSEDLYPALDKPPSFLPDSCSCWRKPTSKGYARLLTPRTLSNRHVLRRLRTSLDQQNNEKVGKLEMASRKKVQNARIETEENRCISIRKFLLLFLIPVLVRQFLTNDLLSYEDWVIRLS